MNIKKIFILLTAFSAFSVTFFAADWPLEEDPEGCAVWTGIGCIYTSGSIPIAVTTTNSSVCICSSVTAGVCGCGTLLLCASIPIYNAYKEYIYHRNEPYHAPFTPSLAPTQIFMSATLTAAPTQIAMSTIPTQRDFTQTPKPKPGWNQLQ